MCLNDYLDVFILCGGVNLIKIVLMMVIVFVIEMGIGNCYIYVDKDV